ncbi:MAG: hypothetical protein RL563_992, partial [Pseudomonadota bacterium]
NCVGIVATGKDDAVASLAAVGEFVELSWVKLHACQDFKSLCNVGLCFPTNTGQKDVPMV